LVPAAHHHRRKGVIAIVRYLAATRRRVQSCDERASLVLATMARRQKDSASRVDFKRRRAVRVKRCTRGRVELHYAIVLQGVPAVAVDFQTRLGFREM
jgi:hypothetical protein